MISHTNKSTLTLRRRSRTKLRKPKYLRLHVISATPPPPMPATVNRHEKQLINLFPLHPENQQDKLLLDDQENNMANIFSSCDDVDGGAATLTGILSSGEEAEEEEEDNHRSPSSVNYADEEVELVRTAMRKNYNSNKLRDNLDDQDLRWVRLASSSSSTSTPSSYHHHGHHHVNHHGHDVKYHDGDHGHSSKLVLKLDYEKIMKSWVNKGPFCIINNNDDDDKSNNNNPDIQTVPELREDDHFIPLNGLTHYERENGGNEGSWTVPEMVSIENNEMGGGDEMMGSNAMIHHREASVQRYKEKRRNRLFAKTIRYEVRKLNAEKRPRIKGRFVKRN